MANLIWTGILYFSTSMIVYIVYRTFMNDRRAENDVAPGQRSRGKKFVNAREHGQFSDIAGPGGRVYTFVPVKDKG